ncbi:hypothetical protein ACL02T_20380 [Pseudonocardia sp. RS010]|uniref:hypothetical protein n=1 Tax=Pseudonocardia sp. RS010 TaxID=3385979 RepID=UPI00399F5ED4
MSDFILPAQLDAEFTVEIAWGADLTDLTGATWTWTDVTGDVYQADSDAVSIKVGRSDEASTAQPAACTLTLDNSAGQYSLGGGSPNWPNVQRNTPLRVRLDAGAGPVHLFVGHIDGFTPSWNVRGNVATVQVSASGALRRLGQGIGAILSPFRRAATSSTMSNVVGYWPLEDGEGSPVFVSGLDGHPPMEYSTDPDLASDSSFKCSRPLPSLSSGATLVGSILSYAGTGEIQARMLLKVPENGVNVETVLMRIVTTGTIYQYALLLNPAGSLRLVGYRNVITSSTTAFDSTYIAFGLNGQAGQVGVQLAQNLSDIDWDIDFLAVGASSSGGYSGTDTGETLGVATSIEINSSPDFSAPTDDSGLVVGHVLVQAEITAEADNILALNAYTGETSRSQRLVRIADEGGVALTLYHTVDTPNVAGITDTMGPQAPTPSLLELLRESETVDGGVLYDGPAIGLVYTSRRYLENRTPTVTIAATQLFDPFEPVHDDAGIVNKVSVSRSDGFTATYEDVAGELGTAVIGTYDSSLDVNYESSDALPVRAGWEVHSGTQVGYRYPTVSVNLASAPELAADLLDIQVGHRIDVSGLPSTLAGHPAGTVSLTVEGYTWSISRYQVTFQANCSPFDRWRIAVISEDADDDGEFVWRPDTSGSTLASSALAGATSLSVSTPSGPLWTTTADDFPLTAEIGGIPVTVTAITGGSTTQTFAVDGSTVTKALAAGAPVQLYHPAVLGL